MKKTDRYQFNLIEKEDTFSPDPLNENTQKLEDQLDSLRAEAAEADAALDQRLRVFEAKHFLFGTYVGQTLAGQVPQVVELGFAPTLLLLIPNGGVHIIRPDYPITEKGYWGARLVGTKLEVQNIQNMSYNYTDRLYSYIALDL